MVQVELAPVQHHAEARAVAALDLGTEVVQQGLHLAPVQVAGRGVTEDRFQGMAMLVAHGGLRAREG